MEPIADPTPEPKAGLLHGRKLPASILAGGAAAAMMLAGLGIANAQTSDSTSPPTSAPADAPHDGHGPGHRGPKADLKVAADAIGISVEDLRTGLEAGKSLATIAGEHGVDAQKVIDALVADAKAHLAQAVTAGKLTQAEADQHSADLEARITKLVNSTPPPRPEGGPGGEGGHRGPGMASPTVAADAIGVTPEQLRTELEAGKSLATIAGEHGVDAQKVIDALVADAKAHLAQAVTAGKLTQAEADQRSADLEARITKLVNSTPPVRPEGDHHRGPGGPGGRPGLDAAAGAIGISVDDLRAGLASGKSLATIAGEHGVDAAKVGDAIVAEAKSHLDEAVSAGKLTQAEADQRLADLQSHLGDLLNRTGPPADGPGHPGPHGPHGPRPEGAGDDGPPPPPADGAQPAVLTA